MQGTKRTPSPVEFYEEQVLPEVFARLDAVFSELGLMRAREHAKLAGMFEDIQNATRQETLDAVRAEMKAAFGTVPAELVNAWRAREKELRA